MISTRSPRSARWLLNATTAATLAVAAIACGPRGASSGGGSASASEFAAVGQLRIDRQDWAGDRSGGVWLRRAVEVTVDVAQRASDATSHIREQGVFTRYAGEPAEVVFTVLAPPGSKLTSVAARRVAPKGTALVTKWETRELVAGDRADPGQAGWRLVFPSPAVGDLLEIVAEVDTPGILDSDARWVRARGAHTAQFLARYNVPTSVAGALQTRGVRAQPLVTEQDGDNVFAVFLKDLPPRNAPTGIVRYASRTANVRGHKHTLASSWHRLARPYQKELLERTLELRAHHNPPKQSGLSGAAAALELTDWVRRRLQRGDATTARWDSGRVLPDIIRSNDLRDIDKVHTLHWVLDGAGIPHQLGVARSTVFPSIDPAFPSPEAFDKPLVYVPEGDLWLDPGCRDCEPGTLRPTLQGAPVLLLPTRPGSTPTETPKREVPRPAPVAPPATQP